MRSDEPQRDKKGDPEELQTGLSGLSTCWVWMMGYGDLWGGLCRRREREKTMTSIQVVSLNALRGSWVCRNNVHLIPNSARGASDVGNPMQPPQTRKYSLGLKSAYHQLHAFSPEHARGCDGLALACSAGPI